MAEQLRKVRADEAAAGKLTSNNVSVEFIDGDPGFYLMRVSWDIEAENVHVLINGVSHIIWAKDSKSYEAPVYHSTSHQIELVAYGVLGPLSSYGKAVTAPTDYVLDKFLKIDKMEIIEVNRFFIQEEGHLLLGGNDLQIIANKIFVDDRTNVLTHGRGLHIGTTIPGTKTADERELSGSKVSIKANEAYGTLYIGMIGMDGKDGLSGLEVEKQNGISRAIDPAKRGQDGSAAVIGWENQEPMPCFAGGIDLAHGVACGGYPTKICKRRATNGTDGLPGEKGTNGLKGSRGGNPGTLIVDIKKGSEFSLNIQQRLGTPGKGGVGADGFPGGEPGKAGTTADSRVCPAARNGQPGARGPKGDDGADGAAAKSLNLDGVNVHIERTLSI
ncbi:MAG: hypothetical protein RBT63_02065 [Bdellovibrionales bacterium]|nr:hypothetical protein [Bdellovibrionales bacterium]